MSRVLTALPSPAPSSGATGLHLPHLSSGQWLLVAVLLVGWLLVEWVRLSAVRRREQRVLDRLEYQRGLARRRADRRLDAEESRRGGGPGGPVRRPSPSSFRLLGWLWCWLLGRRGRRGRSGR